MNPSQSRARLHEWVVVGVFCAFFFFYGLAAFGLVGADEPRYAQIAREMLARHDWVTPTLYGRVWLEKPVLYYWSAMLSYRLLGVSDWTARIPVAVLATLMVVALYLFMRRFRPGLQLHVAMTACSSAAILAFARAGSTDMPLAASFTMGMLAWLAWFQTQERKWLLGFYFFMAGGMLAKGPIALALAGFIIVGFALVRKNMRIIVQTLWIPGVLVFLLTAMPWYVLVQLRNPQFFTEFIIHQNLARFGTNLYRHEQPFWYYLPVLLLGLFPWTVFSLAAWGRTIMDFFRKTDDAQGQDNWGEVEKFLAIWAIAPVIFFSFSQSKLPGYILPAVPAWILLAVLYLAQRSASAARSPILWIVHALGLGGLAGLALLAPVLILHVHEMPPAGMLTWPVIVAVIVAVCLIALVFWRGWPMVFACTLLITVLAAATLLKTATPAIDATQSARPVARYLAASRFPIVIFHVPRAIEYGLGFYFKQEIPAYEAGEPPEPSYFLITRKDDLKELMPIMQQRARTRSSLRMRCAEGNMLQPDTAFRSPVLDLYRVDSESSCIEIFPATGGLNSGTP